MNIPEKSLNQHQVGEISLFSFPGLAARKRLRHFISSRQGGVSREPFNSLNIGFHVGDNAFDVLQNRRMLFDAARADLYRAIFPFQQHTANVVVVDESMRGRGALEQETAPDHVDALVTHVPGIWLCVQMADCVPVLLYDPVQHVVGVVHAGWKSPLRRIVQVTLDKMSQTWGSRPGDMLAGIGPSNGPCCYEVGEDVRMESLRALGSVQGIMHPSGQPGKYIFDQWQANRQQLLEYGLHENQIEVSGVCTQCHRHWFFSSRADHGHTGRFMLGAMLTRA